MMPIANYSTTIRADKTAGEVQRMLANAGARAIFMEYNDDGAVSGLAFQIPRGDHPALSYRLPVNAEAVLKVLVKDRVEGRRQTIEHARRVAWRIVKDWLRAQLALLEAEMADLQEVFLPYQLTKTGATVYEILSKDGFLLPEGKAE
jgi:hypothetical protein